MHAMIGMAPLDEYELPAELVGRLSTKVRNTLRGPERWLGKEMMTILQMWI